MMNARKRFWLAIALLALLMTGPFLLSVLVVFMDMSATDRELAILLLKPHLPLGTLLTVTGFVAGTQILRWLFKQYVFGLSRMAEHLHLMQNANRNFRIAAEGPPEVQALAEAANQLACQRDALMDDVSRQIAEAKAATEFEKNRLVTLVSQLSIGVLVCSREGRIVLYNPRARQLFQPAMQSAAIHTLDAHAAPLGLGRSLFSLLHKGVIEHAQKAIESQLNAGTPNPLANFVTSTRSGLLLRIHLSPVLAPAQEAGAPPEIQGYIFSVDNITDQFDRKARQSSTLKALHEDAASSLDRIRDACGTLFQSSEPSDTSQGSARLQLDSALQTLARRVAQSRPVILGQQTSGMEDLLAADLMAAARRRIPLTLPILTKADAINEHLWIHADSYALLQALSFLALKLHENYEIRELRLGVECEGPRVFLDLSWIGPPISAEILFTWKLEPIDPEAGHSAASLKEVLDRHHADLIYQRGLSKQNAVMRIALPAHTPLHNHLLQAGSSDQKAISDAYDFGLLGGAEHSPDTELEYPLRRAAFTVFDTETTGLNPSGGDEIIQIGALRVLNQRVLHQETFETLINPQCPIPPQSTDIHGITQAMVSGAPTIDVVLPAFHGFSAESVLVAHNAAFDMKFLSLKQDRTGVAFSQPVLDTLLLSSILHPGQDSHKLEDIAQRLGIEVSGRHTALADARMTAEVFARMIPLLEEKGIRTVRQALDASAQSRFAKVSY